MLNGLKSNRFRVVLADPPWNFKSNSVENPGRNARGHYDCMSLEEIAALPVERVVADDAVLFLWITGPFLTIGAHLPIMKAWGFEPSGMGFVWIKLNREASERFIVRSDLFWGSGFTTRKNAEFCLIGSRGKSVRKSASVHEVIIARRREHSRKPDESYQRIEEYADGPRLELFGRQQRRGWTVRGNETNKFQQIAAE